MTHWIDRTLGVTLKDGRSEFKTRFALLSLSMFVVVTMFIMVFATMGETLSTGTLAGILWIIVFFTAMAGMGRSFVAEEERGTGLLLRLLAPSDVVFAGKLLFNVLMLVTLTAATATLYVLLMNIVVKSFWLFALTLLTGSAGLASSSTIVAAIISRARGKGTLYAVLSFPILVPLVILVVDATRMAFDGLPLAGEGLNDVLLMAAYTGVVIGVSTIVFDIVWKD